MQNEPSRVLGFEMLDLKNNKNHLSFEKNDKKNHSYVNINLTLQFF